MSDLPNSTHKWKLAGTMALAYLHFPHHWVVEVSVKQPNRFPCCCCDHHTAVNLPRTARLPALPSQPTAAQLGLPSAKKSVTIIF